MGCSRNVRDQLTRLALTMGTFCFRDLRVANWGEGMTPLPPAPAPARLASARSRLTVLPGWPREDSRNPARSACAALRAPPGARPGSSSPRLVTSAGSTWVSGFRPPSPTARARTRGASLSILAKLRGPWAQPHDGASAAASTIVPIHRFICIRATPFLGSPAIEVSSGRRTAPCDPRPGSRRTLVKIDNSDNPNRAGSGALADASREGQGRPRGRIFDVAQFSRPDRAMVNSQGLPAPG